MELRVTAAPDEPDLLFLPWDLPLEEWPAERLVALPRGISRHVVRFVRLHGVVYAVKEVEGPLAEREYGLLRDLNRLDIPSVEPVGIVEGRVSSKTGERLPHALVTQHLQFSLPYRALFSSTLRAETAVRLLDALAALLVRLHLAGFAWNDCSLSNTLFLRDAGEFAAYLVDAETGELHPSLSDGQRENDLEVARINVFGELLDLQAGEMLHDSIDPKETANSVVERYEKLWAELTSEREIAVGDRRRLDALVRRLNQLGFDVAELSVTTGSRGDSFVVRPKVVDAGHHTRRLLRLTGLDVQENQARRLLNDLDEYVARARHPSMVNKDTDPGDLDEDVLAHRWLSQVFEPVVRSVPRQLRGKLEPAQVFHEVLEHRWFLSEREGRDVGLRRAASSYVDNVLSAKPGEFAVLGRPIEEADQVEEEHSPT